MRDVRVDDTGNVWAHARRGDGAAVDPLRAHRHGVRPGPCRTRRAPDGSRLCGPGVGDDAVGVAALSAAAGLLGGAGMPVWLLASVGEEGLGNLCGVIGRARRASGARRSVHRGGGQLPGTGLGRRRRLGPAPHHGDGPGRPRLGGAGRSQRRPRGGRPRLGDRIHVADRRHVRERRTDRRRRGHQHARPRSVVRAGPAGRRSRGRSRRSRATSTRSWHGSTNRSASSERCSATGRRAGWTLRIRWCARPATRCARPGSRSDRSRRAPMPTPRTRAASPRSRSASRRARASTRRRSGSTPRRSGTACVRSRARWRRFEELSAMSGPLSGVVLQGAYPPAEFEGMVERIDALGFEHLWLTDSSLHARNSYAYLTLAATTSPRLRLGTAVTNPLTQTSRDHRRRRRDRGRDLGRADDPGDRRRRPAADGARDEAQPARLPPGIDRGDPRALVGSERVASRTARSRCTTPTCASPPERTSPSTSPRADRRRSSSRARSRTG